MSHQDLVPVVLRKKSPTRVHTVHQEVPKEITEEIGTLDKVSLTLAVTIQRARIAKGFRTQKELANAVGVRVDIINGYESGKIIPDNVVMQKLRRVLGVRLKN